MQFLYTDLLLQLHPSQLFSTHLMMMKNLAGSFCLFVLVKSRFYFIFFFLIFFHGDGPSQEKAVEKLLVLEFALQNAGCHSAKHTAVRASPEHTFALLRLPCL